MKRLKKAISIILVFVYILTALPLSFSENRGFIQAYAEEDISMADKQSASENGVQPDESYIMILLKKKVDQILMGLKPVRLKLMVLKQTVQ